MASGSDDGNVHIFHSMVYRSGRTHLIQWLFNSFSYYVPTIYVCTFDVCVCMYMYV